MNIKFVNSKSISQSLHRQNFQINFKNKLSTHLTSKLFDLEYVPIYRLLRSLP